MTNSEERKIKIQYMLTADYIVDKLLDEINKRYYKNEEEIIRETRKRKTKKKTTSYISA